MTMSFGIGTSGKGVWNAESDAGKEDAALSPDINRMPNMEDVKIPRFVTITQAAKMGVMSVYSLRLMLKQGQLPGYYAGTRFYINLDRLLEQLENGNSAAGQEPKPA